MPQASAKSNTVQPDKPNEPIFTPRFIAGFAVNFIFGNYEKSILQSVLDSLKDIVSMLLGGLFCHAIRGRSNRGWLYGERLHFGRVVLALVLRRRD